MKKIFVSSVAALLLSSSITVFAATNTYTDSDSGFKLKTQPSWMEIGGKNFYGLANKPNNKNASLNLIPQKKFRRQPVKSSPQKSSVKSIKTCRFWNATIFHRIK